MSPSLPPQSVYERLATLSTAVARLYAEVAPTLQHLLSAEEFSIWAQHCEALAQSGWRTWETVGAFCRLSPFLFQHREVAAVWEWAEAGKALARYSADVATAFFYGAHPLVQHASHEVFATWVAGGQWYLQHYPTQLSLTVDYFRLSPRFYERYPRAVCSLWTQLGQEFARVGAHQVRAFFEVSRTLLDRVHNIEATTPWELAQQMMSSSPEVALQFLARYADLAHCLGEEHLTSVHRLVLRLLAPEAVHASTLLRLVGGTLGLLPASGRRQALSWCQRIAEVSPAGVLAFLQQLPELTRRLPGERLESWVTRGIDTAQRHPEAGQAYFALESATAQDGLRALQSQVIFADVQRVLQLYTEGLAGRQIELRTTADLPAGLHTAGRELPTSDGVAIFVPPQVDDFPEAHDNFAVYKVAILHHLGLYEAGTFTFSLAECMRRMPHLKRLLDLEETLPPREAHTAFARFFAAFAQPELARQLFTVLEAARIDAYVAQRYKGIRRHLALVMAHSLRQRPALEELPWRQALLEGLLQFTLGATLPLSLPPGLRLLLQLLVRHARVVQHTSASVYDTAAAVVHCYLLMMHMPLQVLRILTSEMVAELEALTEAFPDDADSITLADLFRRAGEGADGMPTWPESHEPAEGIAPVPYRGDVKPELIQKKLQLQELTEELQQLQEALSPLPTELLKELLERGEIDIKSVQDGDLSATSGLFISDLEGREGKLSDAVARHDALQQEIAAIDRELQEEFGELQAQDRAFLYDEWDYQIQDYRRHWCHLTETVLDEGDTGFVQETRRQYADLLALVRRQFQLLKPEMFKKMKRLLDGEEIDLDSAIEARVDRRVGNALSEKVYMRRNKRDRDVAAVFLLDLSASTDDAVPEAPATPRLPQQQKPLKSRRFDFSGFVQDDSYAPAPPRPHQETARRRIIDVEKEALVLMAEALEALGDAYAVYGFSGYGRDQVDFFVVKEFHENYDERVQGRIAAMKPHRSTRMGPAIRHAMRKLERQEARIKTLLLVSDGYPQDFDYGKDRRSKEYGIQDTLMALREAQLKGIQTFCLTVDPAGHDYLRDMCPDRRYLIIDDISALPNELPKVYQGLTT